MSLCWVSWRRRRRLRNSLLFKLSTKRLEDEKKPAPTPNYLNLTETRVYFLTYLILYFNVATESGLVRLWRANDDDRLEWNTIDAEVESSGKLKTGQSFKHFLVRSLFLTRLLPPLYFYYISPQHRQEEGLDRASPSQPGQITPRIIQRLGLLPLEWITIAQCLFGYVFFTEIEPLSPSLFKIFPLVCRQLQSILNEWMIYILNYYFMVETHICHVFHGSLGTLTWVIFATPTNHYTRTWILLNIVYTTNHAVHIVLSRDARLKRKRVLNGSFKYDFF